MKQFLDKISNMIDSKLDAREAERKKAEEEAKKKAEEGAKKKEEEDNLKKAQEEIQKRNMAKTKEELEKEQMLNAYKFASTIKEFIDTNRKYLPDNTEDLINILQGKTYASDVEKAQELKRAIVEQYIKEQKNLDMLPEHLKTKAEKYAGLSTKEKLEQADNFYDIVETGIHTEKNIKKFEEMQKGGSGSQSGNAVSDYESKMLKFSQELLGDNKGDK